MKNTTHLISMALLLLAGLATRAEAGAGQQHSHAPTGPAPAGQEQPGPASTVRLSGAVYSDGRSPITVSAEPLASRWQRQARLAFETGLELELDQPDTVTVEPDATGEFLIELPVGLWTLRIEQAARPLSCLSALPLIEDRDLGAVRLPSPSTRVVRVERAGGGAIEGAYVLSAERTFPAWSWSTCAQPVRTGASGEASVHGAGAELVAAAAGFKPRRLGLDPPAALSLQPAAAEWTRLEARDEDGPLGQVLVLGEGLWPIAVSDDGGRFALPRDARFDLLAGDGRLLQDLDAAAFTQADRSGDAAAGSTAPVPAAPVPSAPSIVLFEPPVEIAGRVVDFDGDLATGVAGALVWSQEDPGLWTRADDQGRFSLPHLPLEPAESFPSVTVGFAAAGRGSQTQTMAVGEARSAMRQELLKVELWLPRRPQEARFVGQVIGADGEVIQGARVLAVPAGDRERRARAFAASGQPRNTPVATTDVLGDFSLRVPVREGARWDLVISAGARPPLVVPGLDGLALGERRDVGSLAVPAGWRLAGRVVDSDGRAVEGARIRSLFTVRFGSWSESFVDAEVAEASSDAGGRFTIAGRAPQGVSGGFDITVSKPGFRTATLRNVRMPHASEPDIVLEPLRSLRGRVSTADGDAIEGAQILLGAIESRGDHDHGHVESLAITDAEGRFDIRDFDAEPPWLTVEAEGFATRRVQVDAQPDELDVVLEPSARLTGFVFDVDGLPLPRAVVEAGAALTETGADGAFTIDGLAAGSHRVRAYLDEYGQARRQVRLEAGGTMRLDLTLEPRPLVEGRVVDEQRRPIGGATVFAENRLGQTWSAVTGADGRFRFVELEAGTYSVSAVAGEAATAEPKDFELAGSKATWLLVAAPRGTIAGSITGLDGRAGEVEVSWSCARSLVVSGEVFDDATFRITRAPLGDCWVVGRVAGTDQVASERASLTPEDPSARVELSFATGEAFEGRLLRHGRALDGVLLRLWSQQAQVGSARTDSQGRFRFPRVPEGDYRLSVELSGEQILLSPPVTVPSAATDWHLRTGALELEVQDQAGRRLSFARASVRATGGPSQPGLTSCFDGVCRWPQLAPGRYRLTVGANGFGTSTSSVEIDVSQTTESTVLLSPHVN